MSRVYYIKNRRSGKFYQTEKAFLEAMGPDDKRVVIVYEECDRGISGEMFDSVVKGKERDDQLKIVLGEANKYEEDIYKFREMFIEICPNVIEKSSIIRHLKLNGLNKSSFSSMASKYKNFLLFEISDSVEWYSVLLKCHNFIKLPLTHYKPEYTKSWNGKYTTRRDIKNLTEDQRIENFKLAKESLKVKKPKKLK